MFTLLLLMVVGFGFVAFMLECSLLAPAKRFADALLRGVVRDGYTTRYFIDRFKLRRHNRANNTIVLEVCLPFGLGSTGYEYDNDELGRERVDKVVAGIWEAVNDYKHWRDYVPAIEILQNPADAIDTGEGK